MPEELNASNVSRKKKNGHNMKPSDHPIGIFDSGYGGLTVMKSIVAQLPEYDYLYLGDNARTPYGTRSFETVYQYTLECVKYLFECGCRLIIIACNTASAKALRNIQQKYILTIDSSLRVLGVIRPTTEVVGRYTNTGHVGIMATEGTVLSGSYPIEIKKFFPEIRVYQQACPMWVPLVEHHEHDSPGADYFVKKCTDQLLSQSGKIDTIVLGCTHYPLLINKIKGCLSIDCTLISQGDIVARSLKDYLRRHREIAEKCSKNGLQKFYTTDAPEKFDQQAQVFLGYAVNSIPVIL